MRFYLFYLKMLYTRSFGYGFLIDFINQSVHIKTSNHNSKYWIILYTSVKGGYLLWMITFQKVRCLNTWYGKLDKIVENKIHFLF